LSRENQFLRVKIKSKDLEEPQASSRNKNWKTLLDLPENFWNRTRDLPEKKVVDNQLLFTRI
jgi:hypothetical protein